MPEAKASIPTQLQLVHGSNRTLVCLLNLTTIKTPTKFSGTIYFLVNVSRLDMDDNYIDSLLSSEVYLSILTKLILNLGPNLFGAEVPFFNKEMAWVESRECNGCRPSINLARQQQARRRLSRTRDGATALQVQHRTGERSGT